MMADESLMIGDAARLWAIRTYDPGFADWDAFTEWLESDPRHLRAYEAALDDDAWAADLLAASSTPVSATTALPTPRARRRWFALGGAVAAMLVAVVGGTTLLRGSPEQEVMTALGEHRAIQLSDGSRIQLNGGTRIRFDPDSPREVTLAQGEALFDVKHDARVPFVVVADGTRLVDIGTVFNVVRNGEAMDVAVAEGAVDYEKGADRIRLNQGDALYRADGESTPALRRIDRETIGSWHEGQLRYDDATLDQIARDLSRNTGRPIRATGGTAGMRFTGTLMLKGTPPDIFARAGPLLGVTFVEQGDGWIMSPTDVGRR